MGDDRQKVPKNVPRKVQRRCNDTVAPHCSTDRQPNVLSRHHQLWRQNNANTMLLLRGNTATQMHAVIQGSDDPFLGTFLPDYRSRVDHPWIYKQDREHTRCIESFQHWNASQPSRRAVQELHTPDEPGIIHHRSMVREK
jgi:hypothetical protein